MIKQFFEIFGGMFLFALDRQLIIPGIIVAGVLFFLRYKGIISW
ncbi:hypothetical protein [Desulfitobacterium sp.]|nr:hypothetical protein [Desulfitobacterium sp.]HVJ49388.1 hypothetical protein [Desulfitobacterium sp.]